jgi:hypothetical protein
MGQECPYKPVFKGDYTGFRPIWGGFGVVGVWDPGWMAAVDGGSVVLQMLLYND